MGELAGDECIIRKRATCCILLRKCRRDRFRTLNTNAVYADVEGGQRSVDQSISESLDSRQICFEIDTFWPTVRLSPICVHVVPGSAWIVRPPTAMNDDNAIIGQIQTGQGGAEQTVKKRAEEAKWGS